MCVGEPNSKSLATGGWIVLERARFGTAVIGALTWNIVSSRPAGRGSGRAIAIATSPSTAIRIPGAKLVAIRQHAQA
jgi:hypothetical protein